MTADDQTMPDDLPHDMEDYVSYADELEEKETGKVRVKKKKKGEDDGKGDTHAGSAEAAGQPVVRTAEQIADEEAVKQSWLEKLKLIFIAPFSQIIPGTVSYTAENDLSKKAFFLRVGLYNRQIEPTDIADPELIQKLEDRHQERRHRFGLGPSVVLEYLMPKPAPKGPAGMGLPGLGTSDQQGSGDETGGVAGGMAAEADVGDAPVTAAAVEKQAIKRASIEERDLMAQGATIDEAKAEIDEYTTAEEFLQEMAQEQAFGHIVRPDTAGLGLLQAFNVLAAQKIQDLQAMALDRRIKLAERDGRQESAPTSIFRMPESR